MSELKHCPFCGAKPQTYKTGYCNWNIKANHQVFCPIARMGWWLNYGTEEEAIEAWNRREKE